MWFWCLTHRNPGAWCLNHRALKPVKEVFMQRTKFQKQIIRTKFSDVETDEIIYDPSEELPKDIKVISTEKLDNLYQKLDSLQKELDELRKVHLGLKEECVGLPNNVLAVSTQLASDIFTEEEDDPAGLIGLYLFYYHTAKWQKTNQIWATDKFCMKALKFGNRKIAQLKRRLRELKLIETVRKHKIDGDFDKCYTKVNFIWKSDNQHSCNSAHVLSCTRAEKETYALSNNTINALSNKKRNTTTSSDEAKILKITPDLFDEFWALYPKKSDKGKARDTWIKLCCTKNKDKLVPTWIEVRRAIKLQIRSDRWKKGYIPLATTWLNQSRWIDDPAEMKSFDYNKKPDTELESPNQIIEKAFGKDSQRCIDECLKPVLQISNDSDHAAIAAAISSLYMHCNTQQKRPEYKTVPRVGDSGYGTYCNWRDLIPSPYQLMRRYIDWLIHTRQLTNISHHIFISSGKYFNWFLDDLRKRIVCDPFSGSSV